MTSPSDPTWERPAGAWIPHGLIGLRLAAGPLAVGLALAAGSAAARSCALLLAVGVLSDIFDGVVARRLGMVTARLRMLDSRADVIFWLSMMAAILILHPRIWTALWLPAVALALLEALAHAISFVRFRHEASTHHLLSKLFGLGLWLLFTLLMLGGQAGPLLWAVFALGVASQAESSAIMLVLPYWRTDVRGLGQALALRRAAQR